MAANGPHVNHEGEVINITGRGPNEFGGDNSDDDDDDDARSISPITIGTEWNPPRPSPSRNHHQQSGSGSAKLLGEDSYGMNPALGVNVVVPDKSSRRKRGKSRDRLAAAAGRASKDAVAGSGGGGGGGAGGGKQGRRGSANAHPLWGASGAVAAVTAANYMTGVTGGTRRSSLDRAAAIDAKMAAREAVRQGSGGGGAPPGGARSAADTARASAAMNSSTSGGSRDKDRDERSDLQSMGRNQSASTFGDTAAGGFASVHRRSSDEPCVPKERHEATNNSRRRRDDNGNMKVQGNNSISVSGFADMFNLQGAVLGGKQSSGSTGRSGSRRTAGTGSTRDGGDNDDSSTLFGDAGTFAEIKQASTAVTASAAAAAGTGGEGNKRENTAATATASARAASSEMQHPGYASRSSFNSFASAKPSKPGAGAGGPPPAGGGKTTGLNDSYIVGLNDAPGGKEYRGGNTASSGSFGSRGSGSGRNIAKSDDAIVEGSGGSGKQSSAPPSTTLGRQLHALPAEDSAPQAAGKHLYNKRRSGESDFATVHDRRRSSSDSSGWDALDRRIEELEKDNEQDTNLASAIGSALDAKERSKGVTESGGAGASSNLPVVKEDYREYSTELAPPATEGPNHAGASKRSLRRGSGGSGGEASRGSLSMAMEALGLDRSNSDQMRAEAVADGVVPDDRPAATRPGAVYEHTPAPDAYHYQNVSRPPQATARSRGVSSGSTNLVRSRAEVLRDMEQQEQERLEQGNVGAGDSDGRPRALSEDVDLDAVLRLTAEGGGSDSHGSLEAARFLEEQRAAMERFEANQRGTAANSSSFGGSDVPTEFNTYPNSTDGIATDMATGGAGPNRPLIEISPGRFEFLRGSEETWNAIKRGNYASVTCEACQADLRCVADADMVVCPDCRCVSPLDGRAAPSAAGGFSEGGVGLGVLVKDLAPAVQRRLGVHT